MGCHTVQNSQRMKKKTDPKKQINDMPNDKFHSQLFDNAKKLCNERKLSDA